MAFAPLQPPEAVQLVAFEVLQLKVAAAPLAMLEGVTLRLMTGEVTVATVTLRLVLPPVPVHVSV